MFIDKKQRREIDRLQKITTIERIDTYLLDILEIYRYQRIAILKSSFPYRLQTRRQCYRSYRGIPRENIIANFYHPIRFSICIDILGYLQVSIFYRSGACFENSGSFSEIIIEKVIPPIVDILLPPNNSQCGE